MLSLYDEQLLLQPYYYFFNSSRVKQEYLLLYMDLFLLPITPSFLSVHFVQQKPLKLVLLKDSI